MSFSLIPTSFLIYMKGRTKIAVVFSACFFCTILCMVVCGVFNNPATSVIIFAAAIILIAICLYPGIINNKIVSSKVEFSVEGIEVIDKKGCYWRIIPYEAITNVQVEEVFGFFTEPIGREFLLNIFVFISMERKTIPMCRIENCFLSRAFL